MRASCVSKLGFAQSRRVAYDQPNHGGGAGVCLKTSDFLRCVTTWV